MAVRINHSKGYKMITVLFLDHVSRVQTRQAPDRCREQARAVVLHENRFAQIIEVTHPHGKDQARAVLARLLRRHNMAGVQAQQSITSAVSRFDDQHFDHCPEGRTPNKLLEDKFYRICCMLDKPQHRRTVAADIRTMQGGL